MTITPVHPTTTNTTTTTATTPEFDAVIVGAGFAGLYALHRMRDRMGLSVRAFDAASDVGGTWFWNRYPGARCDIESIHYSYSFSEELQQDWEWSEKFAAQPEILRYLNHVADRFDLRRDISFSTRITSILWDDAAGLWRVRTDDGNVTTAQFVISGAGNLSVPKQPEWPGIENFAGEVYVTGNWPHEYYSRGFTKGYRSWPSVADLDRQATTESDDRGLTRAGITRM